MKNKIGLCIFSILFFIGINIKLCYNISMEKIVSKEYTIFEECLIKDYIKKNISKKFYRYLKMHGVCFFVNHIEKKNYDSLHINDILIIEYKIDNIEYKNSLDVFLDIIYEDEYLMIVDKPHGLQTIPSKKDNNKSLYNVIMNYYEKNKMNNTIHFINRLDKDTGGLLLIAKDRYTALILNKNMDNISRNYYAKVVGIFDEKKGKIINNITKDEETGKRYVSEDGKKSITNYEVIKEENGFSYVMLNLETGRTHQIRVHMSHLGHPVVGDIIYGDGLGDILYLYSYRINFVHPITKKEISFEKKVNWL